MSKWNFLGIVQALILGTLVSFYLFPVGFRGLPESMNGKQLEAVLGIMLFVYTCIRDKSFSLPKYVLASGLIAAVFSVWCFYSMVANGSYDNSYSTYIRAFAIWLFAAYAVVYLLSLKYHKVDLALITKYLAAVCVAQCVFAQLVDALPWFQRFVDTWFIQDRMPKLVERLYGIGASLDSAGVRFCFTQILIAHQIVSNKEITKKEVFWWLSALLLILVLGCMMSRTTSIGGAIAIMYILYGFGFVQRGSVSKRQSNIFRIAMAVIFVGTAAGVYLYNTSYSAHEQLRFAFEAFFNYFETGEFRTDSTDRLQNAMILWPHDTRGWIIGYALFEKVPWGLTDIGYCRFTLYCGLIGLSIFSLFFMYNATVVASRFKDANLLALLLLALTFIIWIKVSTDIFQLYALLFWIAGDTEADLLESTEDDVS